MGDAVQSIQAPARVELDDELIAQLQGLPAFRSLQAEDMAPLEGTRRVILEPAEILTAEEIPGFYALIEGEVEVVLRDGTPKQGVATIHAGETFGEVPLLLRRYAHQVGLRASARSVILLFPKEAFWKMFAEAPDFRDAVLGDFTRRYESTQAMTLHREKLISLGTMAAGLMHELNNPGAAASRAAAQLRENVLGLQQISLRMTRTPLGPEQLECLAELQERAFAAQRPSGLSSLELSDLEEELSGWFEELGVANAWHLAPLMVGAGWGREHIACAQSTFTPAVFSDALNYLGALIGSLQQVGTIEESIARIGDLVGAVKKFAYNDKQREQTIDVRDSLLSTLTILGHKFREKGIRIDRDLPPERFLISCRGAGLAQVWTNLLDNAADAAPEGGVVRVRLWTEDKEVCVGILDNGPGIAQEHREHIYEAFYTTKAVGVGTGLGLEIVHRIVVDKFHGRLEFTTEPGATEFIVHLPLGEAEDARGEDCCIVQR